jgi:hypothetical protein
MEEGWIGNGDNEDSVTATFDDSSIHYGKSGAYNQMFLIAQQNYFNQMLVARGHVFLNEVFDALGIDRTSMGQLVGWLQTGGIIDFGIPSDGEFDKPVPLKFNVQGVIYEEIE